MSNVPVSEIIPATFLRKPIPSAVDREVFAAIARVPEAPADDAFDYANVVVEKPWGYEYLIFQNDNVCVWILYINNGCRTSFHCHPHKRTSLIVLSGEVAHVTCEGSVIRREGEGMLVGEKVFHRTEAVDGQGAFVMEAETPVDKRDLIRWLDDYGRKKQEYAARTQMSTDLRNYNPISFLELESRYHVKRRLGRCSLELVPCGQTREFQRVIASDGWDILSILKGRARNDSTRMVCSEVDALTKEDIGDPSAWEVQQGMEVLLVRKRVV